MFGKHLVFVAIFATAFALQGARADTYHPHELNTFKELESKATIGELVDQLKEIIQKLEDLVGGVIGDALEILGNLGKTIESIKNTILDEGLQLIGENINNVVGSIKNFTEAAAEIGVNISKCVTGRDEQLQELAAGLAANLTECMAIIVNGAMTMVSEDITIITNIVRNITKLPVELSKCMISLRPITCVTELISNAAKMLKDLPEQIAGIVNVAREVVFQLPDMLRHCVDIVGVSSAQKTGELISEIGKCVDEIISGGN